MNGSNDSPIVITGVGVVSPNGADRESYFAALAAGRSGIKPISVFDASDLPSRIAGEVRDLDPGRWIDPKSVRHVSRTVPLALAATREALDDAQLDPPSLDLESRRRIGVLLGSGGGAVEFSERMYELWYAGQTRQASVYSIPSGTIGTIASEISMLHDLHGFSHVVSTGCTSSTDALGYAWMQLKMGFADVVIAGGADATITEGVMTGFSIMKIVSTRYNETPEEASRPFSRDRDGFVLAEGAWMLVLERESSARARGAHIYAELAGYGSTCDAHHRVRLDESGQEPARAMSLAIRTAGVSPEEIDYLNYHGTSTELNDRVETRAVKLAFGRHARSRLAGSATKSMIGHPQGACGAAGVVATLMAFRDGVLPPTINLHDPDPECDLDYVPDLNRRTIVHAAVCNTIAFGSKNSALVLKRL
ncbi:MAG TPA: beta-ketoacyl-[acyl-carrier-protein] synthase family protein [Thermoanaerobaculia bacterium]|nr:beta-ketoacyl-[acyl-carrier-protein] synthase family protein [Thermoanaerobaculia bacterium]